MKPKTVFERAKKNEEVATDYGKIPQNVQYLDSLSVFNSKINPYRKYAI
jgi:hypothetical protein